MIEARQLLRHSLAALAYRTQKALRGAPPHFGSFSAAPGVRTPAEIVHHMGDVMRATVAGLHGGTQGEPTSAGALSREAERFHAALQDLSAVLQIAEDLRAETANRLLQGPLADAMTHAGQLALLRRLAGAPMPGEDFFRAPIDTENVTADQPVP